jgi:hypothetical protein
MTLPLKEETPMPTSSGLGMKADLNYSPLLLPIKTDENLIRISM